MVHLDGGLCVDRRNVLQLRGGAGDRHDHSCRCLRTSSRDRGAGRAVRKLRQPDKVRTVNSFEVVRTGAATSGGQPATQKNVPHRGGEANPSAKALQDKYGSAIKRTEVIWAETVVYVDPSSVHDMIKWLHDDPSQQYDLLSDLTAVEYRDAGVPIEVVWHLRSLPYRRFLRIKAQIEKGSPLEIDSVYDIYRAADWLERE